MQPQKMPKRVLEKTKNMLNIPIKEWKIVHKMADLGSIIEKHRQSQGDNFVFKISKKYLPSSKHSFMVVGDPNSKHGYRLAAIANSKIAGEGILGEGGFGLAKIIQWENGEIAVVKVEKITRSGEDIRTNIEVKEELEIMKVLGDLGIGFIGTPKLDPSTRKTIEAKFYSIQQLRRGKEMHEYLYEPTNYYGALISKIDTLTVQEKLELALQSAIAIKSLHDENIIHCDIKSENFVVNYMGNTAVVKPIDFGFSHLLKNNSEIVSNDARGTMGYIAPEIYDKYIYSKASDIYALGKVFKNDLGLYTTTNQVLDNINLQEFIEPLIESMIEDDRQTRPSIRAVIGTVAICYFEEAIETNNIKVIEKLIKIEEFNSLKYCLDNDIINRASDSGNHDIAYEALKALVDRYGNKVPAGIINPENANFLFSRLVHNKKDLTINDINLIKLLVNSKVKIDILDKKTGCTPLLMLAHKSNLTDNDLKLAEVLINNYANVNRADPEGNTPLLILASIPKLDPKDIKLVNLLIDKGANIYVKNEDNISAIELLKKNNNGFKTTKNDSKIGKKTGIKIQRKVNWLQSKNEQPNKSAIGNKQ